MKVLSIILGVLLIVGGVYCILTPIATYDALSWLIGAAMVVEGIGGIFTWNARRKCGLADGWTLAGSIVSLVLGIFLLGSFVLHFAVDLFIAYLIAAWLVIGGIARIFAAFQIRKFQEEEGPEAVPANWVGVLIIGILVVILGILCFFNPLSIMVGVGFMLGVAVIFVGVDLIERGARM